MYLTFGQFRRVAAAQGWTVEELVEMCGKELEHPTDTIRRIMEGIRVQGHHESLEDAVIPYRCLIELYQRTIQPPLVVEGERRCACGCGKSVIPGKNGRGKWATAGCRSKVRRRALLSKNLAVNPSTAFATPQTTASNTLTLLTPFGEKQLRQTSGRE
jgi:hypothetical protein